MKQYALYWSPIMKKNYFCSVKPYGDYQYYIEFKDNLGCGICRKDELTFLTISDIFLYNLEN